MCSSRRRPLLVPVLLCALALLAARPTDGMDGDTGPGAGLGPQVARLYEDAAKATRQYEDGRREAEAQRSKALEYERRLDGQRQKIDAMHEDLGRIARAQYRDGGGLPLTARMLLADDPEELMRGQRAVSRANLAVDRAIGKNLRAEARLADQEAGARAAWQALEKRNAGLAKLKKEIESKLEVVRSRLEGRRTPPSRPARAPARSASTSRTCPPARPGWPRSRPTSCRRPSAAAGLGGRTGTPARTSRCRSGHRCGRSARAGS